MSLKEYLNSEEYMNKELPQKVIDVTGIELSPGKPDVCLGNGDQGLECCCDECDYYLACFPEFLSDDLEELDQGAWEIDINPSC